MSFLTRYTRPKPPHWVGTQRWGNLTLLPITFLVLLIWILLISDQIYTRILWDSYEKNNKDKESPPISWGIEGTGLPLFFARSFALLAEVIHLPLHHYFVLTGRLHPVNILFNTIIFSIMWLGSVILAITYVKDDVWPYFDHSAFVYDELVIAGVVLQWIVVVLYIVYTVFSCIAVHRWRKGAAKATENAAKLDSLSTRE